jgi:2-iminobutanoate/2-iminopropanoate deaminase
MNGRPFEAVHVPSVPKFNPAAPYSTALRAGNLLFITGQVATDEHNQIVGEGDVRAQVRQIFVNLGHILRAAGGSYANLAKLTYYFQHVEDVAKLTGVREEFLSEPYPAVTGVEIARLADTRLLVEVDAIAVLPEP